MSAPLQEELTVTDFTRLTAPAWEGIPGLVHAFLGRLDHLDSDPPDCARGGRDPICHVKKALALEGRTITILKQVHGDRIVDVEDPAPKLKGEGDALATDSPGVFIGINTADCVPILIVDPKQRVCAAVHAGWRGTHAGIVEKTISHLRLRYGCDPSDLRVALGPAIGRCCFEVGPEVIEAFEQKMGERIEAYVDRRGEKGLMDLRGLNRHALAEAGLDADHIETVGPCTLCEPENFHSYRQAGGAEGRQLSFAGFLP